jgi:CRISPR system Cascade subunit CasB
MNPDTQDPIRKPVTFNDPAVMAAVVRWWAWLNENPRERALLRRCHTPQDVAFTRGYARLRADLLAHGNVNNEALALVAGVLAHVRENTGDAIRSPAPIAVQMAAGKMGSETPTVSDLRFRRLIAARGPDDLYPAMIRAVRLLGLAAHVPSLAKGLYWWNDLTRQTWTFAYDETLLTKKTTKE